MKENYVHADLEIIDFDITDIICSSDCSAVICSWDCPPDWDDDLPETEI